MQEVIVYRNPAEAAFWNMVMSGEFFVVIVATLVFFIVFLCTNSVSCKVWGSYGKAAAVRSYICMFLGMMAALVVGRAMWI